MKSAYVTITLDVSGYGRNSARLSASFFDGGSLVAARLKDTFTIETPDCDAVEDMGAYLVDLLAQLAEQV